jgi:predicted amidohydrolase
MKTFRVALLQLIPTESQEENMEKGIEYCRLAKKIGADLALFPEMWNIGYNFSCGKYRQMGGKRNYH